MSLSTFPAPTEGNWSLSPTKITLVPNFIALSKLYIKIMSTIDTSSTIITSEFIGSSSSLKKVKSSSVENPISSNLCIVFASLLEVSLILFAALPVGAAKVTLLPLFSNMSIIALIVVVLPVPGPPVIINTPLLTDSLTAKICFSANLIFLFSSKTLISLSISIFKSSNSYCDNFTI
ncbi:Uncharacterised protein [Clostridioides difficile]|nr:Uncharacterised protein [Clostridioides difficile]